MALVAFASAKGSPGVTTSVLALASVWPEPPVLVAECDPTGGDVLPGYLSGQVEADRGLHHLVLTARRTGLAEALDEQLLTLDQTGPIMLLPGVSSPAQAGSLGSMWDPLGRVLAARDGTVLADCGRLAAAHVPTGLLHHARVVVLVVHPTLVGVAAARWRLELLRPDLPRVDVDEQRLVVLLTGAGDYPASDVARVLDTPVIGVLPADPAAAAVFSNGAAPPRGFTRSGLLRSARRLAGDLHELAARPPAHTRDAGQPAAVTP